MANEITPHLTAEEYMDKGEYENELKQVIGDTKVHTTQPNFLRVTWEDNAPLALSVFIAKTVDETTASQHSEVLVML